MMKSIILVKGDFAEEVESVEVVNYDDEAFDTPDKFKKFLEDAEGYDLSKCVFVGGCSALELTVRTVQATE